MSPHEYIRERIAMRAVLGLTLIAILQLARIAVQGGERRAEQEREQPAGVYARGDREVIGPVAMEEP